MMRTIFNSFVVGVFFTLCSMTLTSTAAAQPSTDGVWNDILESSISPNLNREIIPAQYRTLALNIDALMLRLSQAPMEGGFDIRTSPVTVNVPLPQGGYGRFHIVESPIMAPELARKYPEIRTYLGQGIDDATATIRFDVTPVGFHAMIIAAGGTTFIDPYSRGNTRDYITYFKRDLAFDESRRFEEIGVVDPNGEMAAEISRLVASNRTSRVGEELLTYRLALACTGEYATFHGGTVPLAMAAIVTAMNRVDGVYEREVAVRMVLIANNDLIVYTNASTDPYTNNNGSTMLGQNQTTLDNVIGTANYDIGHVFSTGGGGVAGLGVVCRAGQKARGVTGLSSPIGDPFYIDYVAHEMGHEFGGNHSFNSTTSSCGGGNRAASKAYEPGSGTTIMAYAGICGADDIQAHSDDYFHLANIDEIVAYTTQGSGNSCPVITSTGNNAPVISIGAGGNTIPLGTSFSLTGSASDPDGDTLTYCWEEFDLGPGGAPNSPSGNAPIFRSFTGTRNLTRLFPRLSNILSNTQTIGEILPSSARNLSFRLTVRDNRAGGGGVGRSSTLTISVAGTAGPFAITSPNGGSWLTNSVDTVKWNVANTDIAPVNCTTVNILFSTDGGLTFPTILAANTPNDGVQPITVPNILTESARVKIEATDNIFFDISNANHSISLVASPLPIAPPNNATSQPTSLSLRWRTAPAVISYHLQLATNPTFSTTIINDSTMTDTSRAITGLAFNTPYYWRVRARNSNGTSGWSEAWTFRTAIAPPATPTLVSPPNNAINLPDSLTLQWGIVIGATSFQLQVSVDSLFATTLINDSTITVTQRNITVSSGTRYYWHVRARNAGGPGAYSATWNFTTVVTSVLDRPGMPSEFVLSQNYPNPFNPSTVIEFALPHESIVTLGIYNLLGERVAQLVEEKKPAGYYSVTFNARGLATGLYFYKLQAGDPSAGSGQSFVQTRKLVLLR
jgi:hypothetical protein